MQMTKDMELVDKTLPPSAFQEAAKAYWAQQAEASASEAASVPFGVTASIDVVAGLGASLLDAFEHEVLHPVVWGSTIPVDHPIRKLSIFVKLWNSAEWTQFWKLHSAAKASPEQTEPQLVLISPELSVYWYALAISVVDAAGVSIWPTQFEATDQLQKWLALKYDGPKGRIWTDTVFDTAMTFNGLGLQVAKENETAKNSDTTTTSASSEESSV